MENGRIINRGSFEELNKEIKSNSLESLVSVNSQNSNDSIDYNSQSISSLNDIKLSLNRLSSISSPKLARRAASKAESNLINLKEMSGTKIYRSVSIKLVSKQQTETRHHAIPELKNRISTVSMKDWWTLFSYGIGNFWVFVDVILS